MSSEDFSIVEKRDEAQIIAEMQGQVIEEYFYMSKGKPIMSYVGVKEISRNYGNNDADLVDMKETETAWIVVCKATDLERNITRLGVSTQLKLEKIYKYEGTGDSRKRVKDNSGAYIFTWELDEFCIQKAFSKSQRNALKAILPVTIITKAIEAWKNQKKGASTKQSRRQVESEVNIIDFMKPTEIIHPETPLIDELARFDENWELGVKLTEDWMVLANINPSDFLISSDSVKLTVSPKKQISKKMLDKLEKAMATGGFLQAKIRNVDGWRMNKKDVTG